MTTVATVATAAVIFDAQTGLYRCKGAWTLETWQYLNRQWLQQLRQSTVEAPLEIKGMDGSEITALDSAGASLIKAIQKHQKLNLISFSTQHQRLLAMTAQPELSAVQPPQPDALLAVIGKSACRVYRNSLLWLAFIGEWVSRALTLFARPSQFPWRVCLNQIDGMGFQALPIIGLLTFLIGVVLANQTGEQLKLYGADIYIVNITGIAILREFSPLITAIILAGRTGAALTASLGSMKVNEELDALSTMGLSPFVQLVMPRLLALIVVLPLLVVWGDIFGLLGSFVMSQYGSGIGEYHFLSQLQEGVPIQHYWIGLSKAPLFALIIGLVGCFQGFQVEYSAESVGRHTTQSVVQSIFLIIIVDALFAIFFTWNP